MTGRGADLVELITAVASTFFKPRAAEGIVEFVANPRHKRSKLVRLTAKGQDIFAAIDVLRRLADRAEAFRAEPKASRPRG